MEWTGAGLGDVGQIGVAQDQARVGEEEADESGERKGPNTGPPRPGGAVDEAHLQDPHDGGQGHVDLAQQAECRTRQDRDPKPRRRARPTHSDVQEQARHHEELRQGQVARREVVHHHPGDRVHCVGQGHEQRHGRPRGSNPTHRQQLAQETVDQSSRQRVDQDVRAPEARRGIAGQGHVQGQREGHQGPELHELGERREGGRIAEVTCQGLHVPDLGVGLDPDVVVQLEAVVQGVGEHQAGRQGDHAKSAEAAPGLHGVPTMPSDADGRPVLSGRSKERVVDYAARLGPRAARPADERQGARDKTRAGGAMPAPPAPCPTTARACPRPRRSSGRWTRSACLRR